MEKGYIVNLGSIDGVPIGQGKCFIVKGEEVAVFRLRDGNIFAIQNKCPHLKGPLSDGIVGDGKVICPLHGHKFDLSTGQGSEQDECVRVFESWIEHNYVYIEYTRHLDTKEKIHA